MDKKEAIRDIMERISVLQAATNEYVKLKRRGDYVKDMVADETLPVMDRLEYGGELAVIIRELELLGEIMEYSSPQEFLRNLK